MKTIVSPVKTIALFVCGSLADRVEEVYGSNGIDGNLHVFQDLLSRSLPQPNAARAVLHPYDVHRKMEYPSEERIGEYDGIILSGSVASAYEDLGWINRLVKYIRRIAEERPGIKILGSCFGHQIIGRAFDSECLRSERGWELGPTPVQLTKIGKSLFCVDSLNLTAMHLDYIPVVPSGFHLLGSTAHCHNQGMVKFHQHIGGRSADDLVKDLTNVQILTTQGHPEYDEAVSTSTIRYLVERIGPINVETLADAERRRYWREDGVLVGKAFWRMLGISGNSKKGEARFLSRL